MILYYIMLLFLSAASASLERGVRGEILVVVIWLHNQEIVLQSDKRYSHDNGLNVTSLRRVWRSGHLFVIQVSYENNRMEHNSFQSRLNTL